MVSGERKEIGAVVELSDHMANLVISANKAQPFIAPPPEPEPEPKPAPRRKPASTPAPD